jgi:hypothetical protein
MNPDMQTLIVCALQINNGRILLFHGCGQRGDKDCRDRNTADDYWSMQQHSAALSVLHGKAVYVQTDTLQKYSWYTVGYLQIGLLLKNATFWDGKQCGSSKNRRFVGTSRFHVHDRIHNFQEIPIHSADRPRTRWATTS